MKIGLVTFAAALAMPLATFAQTRIEAVRNGAAPAAADPDHPAWYAAPANVIPLETAFPAHPSIVGTAVTRGAEVKALRSAKGLAIRLEWNDPVADTRLSPDRFADGVAIQFPQDGDASTPPTMGGGGKAVNVWYWNAAKNVAENLSADGFGTLTRLPRQDVTARGRHVDGKWRVAFFRPWRSRESRAARLAARAAGEQPVAFAVWDGANAERDGFKAVTLQWQTLRWAR